MTQPSPSLISSVLVFLRSPRLRRAAAAGLWARARSLQTALGPKTCHAAASLLMVGAFAGVVFGIALALSFIAPKAGRLIELATDASAPRVFYTLPAQSLSPVALDALKDLGSRGDESARALARKLALNQESGMPLAGLSKTERESLLISAGGRRARLSLDREAAAPPPQDPEALLARAIEQDALRLARLLREGASPERAARALRDHPTPVAAPVPFEPPEMGSSERGLMALERALEAAPEVSVGAISLFERFSPSWDAFPHSGRPLAYAEEQSNSDRTGRLLLLGLAPLLPLALGILFLRALLRWARSLASGARAEIERERELQAIGKATFKAPNGASSKPPRL